MSIIQEHVCLSILPFSITPFICQSYYCGNKDNVFLRPIITYSVFQIVNSFAVLLRQNFLNCLLRICCTLIVCHCNNNDYQCIIIYSKSIILNKAPVLKSGSIIKMVIDMVNNAMKKIPNHEGLILHSDQ